ncbi:hypothetical protein [Homoserinimonas hongtaonis]|uniref:Uncharacterized protein n=1 Tax=Homoserinimonas hongtaonis TaxID=2079791 RepID=A0A2U1SZC6_9MICO|nr:hypothetical protein [Salinibacterium hongtaonis]PWB96985.1 hypothetical protein DF220_03380 [Salinibacterium hongtaonis]
MTDRSLEAEFAPDIDAQWAGDFILEARLLDVPGDRIGDSLNDVNTHCRDAREAADIAFGDPTEYARVIAAQSTPSTTRWLPLLGPTTLQIIGVVLGLHGVGGWVTGNAHPLTWSTGAMLIALIGGVSLLSVALSRSLRAIVRRPFIGALLVGVAGALLFAGPYLLLLIETPPLPLPTGLVIALGITILVIGIGLAVATARTGNVDDPISAPGIAPRSRREKYLVAGAPLAWLVVGATLIILFAPR